MQLHPCGRCRRHVRDATCPFCGAEQPTLLTKLAHAGGRLSRAAVFASAAACYTNANTPPQQPSPPPPPEGEQSTQPPDGQQFARPPDDSQRVARPATGSIEGSITQAGAPRAGIAVQLQGDGGGTVLDARTDASGKYVFAGLVPGSYMLFTSVNGNPHRGQESRRVIVRAGDVVRADFQVAPYVPDRGPCCKPYGAPPARRRIV